jgi:hypothetical protein
MKKHYYFLKGFLTLILFFVFTFFFTASYGQYCPSKSRSTTNGTACGQVDIVGLNVNFKNESWLDGCLNYTDNTSTSAADLSAGSTYTITVQDGFCNPWSRGRKSNAWIDFNGDGDFSDPGEMLGDGEGSGLNAMTFTVPCNINVGNTRLRVIVIDNMRSSLDNP